MKSTNLVKIMTTHINMQHGQNNPQSGFTLIELMIIITIIAMLAAIAIPSYREMMIKNAEAKTEAKVKQLLLELDTWRANTLSYRGFSPKKVAKNGTISYTYDANNTTIFLPVGSNASNADYQIVIDNGSGGSLTANADLNNVTAGSSWRIYATPLNRYASKANLYYINSTGMRCKSKSSTFTTQLAEKNNCAGEGVSTW